MGNQCRQYVTPLFIVVTAGLLQCGAVQASSQQDTDSPVAVSNRNPFVAVYGLPVAQSARLLGASQLNTALQVNVANSFSRDQSGNEAIFIDGETLHTNLQLRYGLSDRLELGLDLPYISHDGGSLDSFIDSWHEAWGLPDGDRPSYAEDQLTYDYQGQGNAVFSMSRAEQGVGDASLTLAYQLSNTPQRQWALRGALKLPTGDADVLLGSKSTDVSMSLHVSDQSFGDEYRIGLHASAGLLWMDEGEVLNQLREDWVAFGSATLSWQFTPAVNLKLQLDAHSAFYDSSLTELGRDAVQLTLGGTVNISNNWSIDLAVVEDIAVDTSPDVVFHIAVKAMY
jgi:hypothetical protein